MAKKKEAFSKKVVIIGVALILLQLGYIFFFTQGGGSSFVEQMNRTVAEDSTIPADRKAQVKLQLALRDYQVKNKDLPDSLEQLVPGYFDSVPLDPETGEPFQYTKLEDGRFYLGDPPSSDDEGTIKVAGKSKKKKGKGKSLLGTDDGLSQDDQAAVLAMLNNEEDTEEDFVYDPSGKRDPFRSFDFSPKQVEPVGDTPLEQFGYKDLQLTAVLEGMGDPRAIVETPQGKGYTVEVGSKIGLMGGKIMKIEPDRLMILETTVDWDKQKRTRTVEMFLR